MLYIRQHQLVKMSDKIIIINNMIPAFLEGVKNRKEKMFGFGHRSGPASVVLFIFRFGFPRNSLKS